MFSKISPFVLAVALVGCGTQDPGQLGGGGASGNGGGGVNIKLDGSLPGSGGVGGSGTSTLAPGEILMMVRDFRFYDASDSKTNPDFENVPKTDENGDACTPECYGPWHDADIVSDTLGSDYKPAYKKPGETTLTTHGQEAFAQWYRTVDGTNVMQEIPLKLTEMPDGSYQYDSKTAGPPLSPGGSFFPLDDGTPYATAYGNQGKAHNYSFTVEIHTLFTYQGGEHFYFSGDDDVFVFINNKLVINIGGIHGREEHDVLIDSLGLKPGETYPLDFFYAERHVVESNLKITTTLDLSTNTEIPIF